MVLLFAEIALCLDPVASDEREERAGDVEHDSPVEADGLRKTNNRQALRKRFIK
jgi:hypothetical protein